MMKRITLIYSLCLLLSWGLIGGIMAQPRSKAQLQERAERLEAYKVGYFTKKMALSTAEARLFWPVYDAYQEELTGIRKDARLLQRKLRQQMDVMADKELEDALDAFLAYKQQEVELAVTYKEKFNAVLPIRKVVAYFRAEQEFNRTVVANYKDRLEKRLNEDKE